MPVIVRLKKGARHVRTHLGLIEQAEILGRELFTQRQNLRSLDEIEAIYVRSYHERAS